MVLTEYAAPAAAPVVTHSSTATRTPISGASASRLFHPILRPRKKNVTPQSTSGRLSAGLAAAALVTTGAAVAIGTAAPAHGGPARSTLVGESLTSGASPAMLGRGVSSTLDIAPAPTPPRDDIHRGLYSAPGTARLGLTDLTTGTNAANGVSGYGARRGYDLPSGIGTVGNSARFVSALAAAAIR
ncbi:hypothetical protein ACGFJT_42050 [Actinomadura geliboluensis]|uniref:hypothetical protein n=1 Tax=Actinomadura geliboluensis TaxID=882440 RepID=UPI003721584C